MFHHSKIIAMFAVLNMYNNSNAGSQLAFTVQAFFMPGHSITSIWYPCTPVWNCNGTTAFELDVLSSGKGTDTFFIKPIVICLTTIQLTPILQCLAASERPPTKRVSASRSTATPCDSTPLREHAAGERPLPHPCAKPSAGPCSPVIRTSAASKSKTAASSSRPVYGCVQDASSTIRHTPCETFPASSAQRSSSAGHSRHKPIKKQNCLRGSPSGKPCKLPTYPIFP